MLPAAHHLPLLLLVSEIVPNVIAAQYFDALFAPREGTIITTRAVNAEIRKKASRKATFLSQSRSTSTPLRSYPLMAVHHALQFGIPKCTCCSNTLGTKKMLTPSPLYRHCMVTLTGGCSAYTKTYIALKLLTIVF